jgi:hypothetical protein
MSTRWQGGPVGLTACGLALSAGTPVVLTAANVKSPSILGDVEPALRHVIDQEPVT